MSKNTSQSSSQRKHCRSCKSPNGKKKVLVECSPTTFPYDFREPLSKTRWTLSQLLSPDSIWDKQHINYIASAEGLEPSALNHVFKGQIVDLGNRTMEHWPRSHQLSYALIETLLSSRTVGLILKIQWFIERKYLINTSFKIKIGEETQIDKVQTNQTSPTFEAILTNHNKW